MGCLARADSFCGATAAFVAVASVALASSAAVAAETASPPSQPFLRIEAGMHTASIRRIDVDRAGKYLVTGSYDKTARIWSVEDGQLLQVLRPPMGHGYDGRINAVAMSPDASRVAIGGATGYEWAKAHSIYVFDRLTGKMVHRVSGLPQAITHLAFSADGRRLAVCLWGKEGIRILEATGFQEVSRSTDYGDTAYWVEFDQTGRFVTASYDGHVRLYGQDSRVLARKSVEGSARPFSARFSPDGSKVAVGFDDSTAVVILAGTDLRVLYRADTRDLQVGNLSSVAWSSEGQRLYAGGSYDDGTGNSPIVTWSAAGRGPRRLWKGSMDSVMDIRALPQGRVVFAGSDPVWWTVDPMGKTLRRHNPPIADHRFTQNWLRLSRDASVIDLRVDIQETASSRPRTVRFDVARLGLTSSPKSSRDLFSPRTDGLPVNYWRHYSQPQFAGRPIRLEPREISRSLAITPDASGFLLGTAFNSRFFDKTGRELWRSPAPGTAWAVNVSRDGRWAVGVFGDGTVRWFNLADGRERLALFMHPDGKRWVAFTPEGFFAASEGGDSLVGYHLNRGAGEAGEFVGVKQLFDLYYRPDLVARSLQDGWKEVSQRAIAAIGDIRTVLTRLPPKVEILPGHRVGDDGQLELKLRVTNRGGGVGRLVYRINDIDLEPRAEVPSVPGQDQVTVRLPVAAGAGVKVAVSAYNERGQIQSRPAEIKIDVASKRQPVTLHMLAVGVSRYRSKALELKYARKDAEAMVAEFERRGQGLFDKVNMVPPLLDENATIPKLEAAFAKLAPMVKPNDVFIFFAAGHGTVRDGKYLFLPADLSSTNDETIRTGSLNEEKLRDLLAKISAQKSLVMLDTCASGTFASNDLEKATALDRLTKATGRAVLAASSDDKMALEGYRGHGVLTAALLDGLERGDRNRNGMVDVDELADYVADEVPRITKEKWQQEQHPQRNLALRGPAFDLARAR